MSSHSQQAHLTTAITERLSALGVSTIVVEVDDDLITYLRGELAAEDLHPQVIEATYAAGAVQIVDGLTWPGYENSVHVDRPHAIGVYRDHSHEHARDPGVEILQGARLEGRLFDSNAYVPVRTGNSID